MTKTIFAHLALLLEAHYQKKSQKKSEKKSVQYLERKIEIPLITGPDQIRENNPVHMMLVEARNAMRNFVFRRVGSVRPDPDFYLGTSYMSPDENGNVKQEWYPQGTLAPDFTQDEILKNVSVYYRKYSGLTAPRALRDEEPRCRNKPIEFNFGNHMEFDLVNFKFVPFEMGKENFKLPRKGDMVCGLVASTGLEGETRNKRPYFKYWFTCSEQFFRFWTAVMFDCHDSFTMGKVKDEDGYEDIVELSDEQIHRNFFKGNHLMTNTFRKYVLSCEQTGLIAAHEEIKNRFWDLRTERMSRDYVHVYCALLLILRYGRIPCPYNVPSNMGTGPWMTKWDIPDGWIDTIAQKYGLRWESYSRIVRTPTLNPENLPKNTRMK